jgi:glycerol kinase
LSQRYVLALDQGTTSSRAMLFGRDGRVVAVAQREFPQIFPKPGDVEHDPEAIWTSQIETAREVLRTAGVAAADVAAIGVTNQRETTVLWDRQTGKPVAPAIVWQSRVSAPICDRLKADGHEALIRRKTGLVVDAYFSGTKVTHLLETVPGLRARAEAGDILFGTIDTFLIWRLTGGQQHVTDVTNASRTLMYDIHALEWDDELLRILGVPRRMLPTVHASSEIYGYTDKALLGESIPIAGIAGDQQAALFGQACFTPGMAKNTYGTGCFLLMNTGTTPTPSAGGLLTTIAWKVGGEVTYALEGAVFIAGAAVQWMRDGLRAIVNSADIEQLATSVPDAGGVYLVPAFVGLGAPYWDAEARGAVFGLTRNAGRAELARAALEAVGYQTRDLLTAMRADWPAAAGETVLRVDGGLTANDWCMQFLADILDAPVDRPRVLETTALGAAYLAGRAAGLSPDLAEFAKTWRLERRFLPRLDTTTRERKYAAWREAVRRTLTLRQ